MSAIVALPTAVPAAAAGKRPTSGSGKRSTAAAGTTATPGSSTTGSPILPPAGSTTPFAPGVPQSGAATPTSTGPATVAAPTQNTGANGSSGLSGAGIVLVVVGALALLVGISFFIWYDARRRAPVKAGARGGHGDDDFERRSKPGSKRQQKPRKLSPAERRRRKRGRAR